MAEYCVFNYCYRDASNYKAWGRLLLRGKPTRADTETLRKNLDAEECFIAEQLGIPTLYAELWALSNGPSTDDHVWHTFDNFSDATDEEMALALFDTVENLIFKIQAVQTWDETLSPHWNI